MDGLERLGTDMNLNYFGLDEFQSSQLDIFSVSQESNPKINVVEAKNELKP